MKMFPTDFHFGLRMDAAPPTLAAKRYRYFAVRNDLIFYVVTGNIICPTKTAPHIPFWGMCGAEKLRMKDLSVNQS